LLQCPLLQGLDAMHRAELIGLLQDSNVQEKIEQCLAERAQTASSSKEPAAVCACETQPRNFEKEVHTWDPQHSPWNRSPKE
jgi:hypothetical protein